MCSKSFCHRLVSVRIISLFPWISKLMIIRGRGLPLTRKTTRLHKVPKSRTHAAMLGAYFFDLLGLQLPQDTRGCDTTSRYCRYSFHRKANAAEHCVFPVRDICPAKVSNCAINRSGQGQKKKGSCLQFALTSINFIRGSSGPPVCTPSPRSPNQADTCFE